MGGGGRRSHAVRMGIRHTSPAATNGAMGIPPVATHGVKGGRSGRMSLVTPVAGPWGGQWATLVAPLLTTAVETGSRKTAARCLCVLSGPPKSVHEAVKSPADLREIHHGAQRRSYQSLLTSSHIFPPASFTTFNHRRPVLAPSSFRLAPCPPHTCPCSKHRLRGRLWPIRRRPLPRLAYLLMVNVDGASIRSAQRAQCGDGQALGIEASIQ